MILLSLLSMIINEDVISDAIAGNGWFTRENIIFAFDAVNRSIKELKFQPKPMNRKNVGVIMAGNIPLVGFFDMMYVIASGHKCFIKPSSKDSALINYIVSQLEYDIEYLNDDTYLDAVIATGSNNSNRYFKTFYDDIPRILRGNRTSVAVLNGDEDMTLLWDDIFVHFGLGCRNVSMIFIPQEFDVEPLGYILSQKKINFPRYINTYRYRKALLTMRGENFYDGEFFTLRESHEFSEGLSDIVFQRYKSLDDVKEWLSFNDSEIQCVVSQCVDHPRSTLIGTAQCPKITDYPDGIDVLNFLTKL